MESSVINQFTLNFREVVIDEIALEGLDGIVIELLWRRLEKRLSTNISEKSKDRIWNFIRNYEHFTFYKLPEPRARLELLDRFGIIDEQTGHLLDHSDYLDGPYEYHPTTDNYGSCEHYTTRVNIPREDLQRSSLNEIEKEYGNTFIIVASLEERWHALAPHYPFAYLDSLTQLNYCILELIGRSRENGQMSIGKTNLLKVVKDAKFLFYNRKCLKKLDLIRTSITTHICGGRGVKTILMRLKRFYVPRIASLPKYGKIYDVVQYLKTKPNLTVGTDELVKQKLADAGQIKRMKKSTSIFSFEDREEEKQESNRGKRKSSTNTNKIMKWYITLITESDDSSASEDETDVPTTQLESKYKIGVSLLRQAYELFLEAGLKGLTQIELSQSLGVEFYTSRCICKIFKGRNIVRQILEDRGRQKATRFIAIAGKGEMDIQYAQERQKLLDCLNDTNFKETSPKTEEPPAKKSKPDDDPDNISLDPDSITEITSVDVTSGYLELLNATKGPSLRQLKYANGILKVTREKFSVAGYQTLSNLVAIEIDEPKMDTKALKQYVYRLYLDGQLKLFNLKWPGQQKITNLICAPQVTKTHQVIQNKYKEICLRSFTVKKSKPEPIVEEPSEKTLKFFSYPRYMKIRKLHEFLIELIYFTKETLTNLPEGFGSLIHILPELTVEIAIGHITPTSMREIESLAINDKLLKLKLKDTPINVYKMLLQCQSLQNCLKSNLQNLAAFGLIQLCHKRTPAAVDHHSGLLKYIFYVNRNAKVVDTKGTWPRSDADVKALEKRFCFETADDVKNYWDTLYNVAVHTKVVGRTNKRGNVNTPIRSEEEVKLFDTGEIYGDGRGPAGLDSSYHAELPRQWEKLHIVNYKRLPKAMAKLKKSGPKKPTTKKRNPKHKKKTESFKKLLTKANVAKQVRKRAVEWTVKWNKSEDKIIMLCKAAMAILSPTSQPGCLTIRNLVAKDILTLSDPVKTASHCHKRCMTLELNSTLTHERECLINEMKRRPHLIAKYENGLKKLRAASVHNMTKYINTARPVMMELVWILYQLSKSKSYNQRMPCVALSLEDFNENYSITASTSSKPYNLYKTSPEWDIEIGTLKEGIVMVMTYKIDKEIVDVQSAAKIHGFLEKYDERKLRIALEHLRKSSTIVLHSKCLAYIQDKYSYEDLCTTSNSFKAAVASYRLGSVYFRRFASKFNSDFVDNLSNTLRNELPKSFTPSAEIICTVCEMMACDNLEISMQTVPAITGSAGPIFQESEMNQIDIEAHFKLKPGVVQWQNKTDVKIFSEIMPKYDDNVLEAMIRRATIQVQEIKEKPDDELISYLTVVEKDGATFTQLKDALGISANTLKEKLKRLDADKIISRVGFFENYIVLTDFVEPWSLQVGKNRVIPIPWLTLDGKINKVIFMQWCGMIINKVTDYPGISISNLADDCYYASTRAIQDLCMFLESFQCVKLKVLKAPEPDLFSDDYIEPELSEFNEYESPESILVFPVKDLFTKFACIRKDMLNTVVK